MTDDDLRFGDVGGTDNDESSNNDDIVNSLIKIAKVFIVVYVILAMMETMLNISIPVI